MKHHGSKFPPFTDLFILTKEDFADGFDGTTIELLTAKAGDVLLPAQLIEVKKIVAGPSDVPTAQITIGEEEISEPLELGALNLSFSQTDYILGTDTVEILFDKADGNGAAATAGEIWIWLAISRKRDRCAQVVK